MSESREKSEKTPTPTEKSPVILLLGTAADATWRMFVPTIGLLLLGVWVDSSLTTLPWFTFIGLGIGVLTSTLLIKRLYKKI